VVLECQSEIREQRSDDGGQKTEVRRQRIDVRGWRLEVRGKKQAEC